MIDALRITNGRITLAFAPELGGRMMELAIKGRNLLYVNPDLKGRRFPREQNVGGFECWKNYGGSVTWLAPQGWNRDDAWHGPPDATVHTHIDSGVWVGTVTSNETTGVQTIQLEGPEDHTLGVQLSKAFTLYPDSDRVDARWTMRNPRPAGSPASRWAIWENTPIDASAPGGWNDGLEVWIPRCPASSHVDGFHVMFAAADNSQWRAAAPTPWHRVPYLYQVGKAAWDCRAGHATLFDRRHGWQFHRVFGWRHDMAYPDGNCNLALWTNGAGEFRIEDCVFTCPDDPETNRPVLEFETMSPLFDLLPSAPLQTHSESWWLSADA